MVTKKAKIIGVLAGLVGLVAVGTGAMAAHAASNSSQPNFLGNLANAIAKKFNLNPSDVQQVVDAQIAEQKAQMQASRQQTFTDRINKAVADGKLTQDQANKILTEKASIDAQIAALKDKNKDERKAALKQIKDEEKQWAVDNNLSPQYLMFGFRGHGAGKDNSGRGMGHKGADKDKAPKATPPAATN